jgi:hypothetical protein
MFSAIVNRVKAVRIGLEGHWNGGNRVRSEA